jgi:hypothetical protein
VVSLGTNRPSADVVQDKTNSVIDLYKDILRAVEDLATCSFTTEAFSDLLSKVQTVVSVYLVLTSCADDSAPIRSTV